MKFKNQSFTVKAEALVVNRGDSYIREGSFLVKVSCRPDVEEMILFWKNKNGDFATAFDSTLHRDVINHIANHLNVLSNPI